MAQMLTDDLVIEILSWLPVKSLMRFKCVSKQWRSLISGQRFARLHLQRLLAGDVVPSQKIIKSSPLQTVDYEALDSNCNAGADNVVVKSHELGRDDPSEESGIVGSCDGLVCLLVWGGFILYNPTTKESRNLPDSDLVPGYEVFHGFGYDSASDDYKIVKGAYVPANNGSKECVVEIFSLRSSTWERIPHKDVRDLYGGGVYLNGAVHWYVSHGSRDRREQEIVSFDLAEEEFWELLPIPTVEEGVIFEGLGIHGRCLFMYYGTWLPRCEVWIMKEYGNPESWMKWFIISTEGLPACQYYIVPLACTRNGKIVFQIDVWDMILFDPEDGTFKNYPIEEDDNIESAIYLETLISPFLNNE